jgi:CheY-like chemotaxis protein
MALLQIVYLETNDADAELVRAELKNTGIESDLILVRCKEELLKEMARQPIDLVLADPSCPSCEGLRALTIAREQQGDIPFIFVASLDEPGQVAEALRNGATVFIFKQHLE